MKKAVKIIFCAMLSACFLLSVVACQNNEPVIYGKKRIIFNAEYLTVDEYPYKYSGLSKIEKFYEDRDELSYDMGNVTLMYNFVDMTIRDVKEIRKKEIYYVVDEVEETENPVITTKWVYYTLSMLKEWCGMRNVYTIRGFDDFDVFLDFYNDDYCMEKVAFDTFEYVCADKESKYYGLTVKQAFKKANEENSGKAVMSIVNWLIKDDPVFGWTGIEKKPFLLELFTSAMHRYGLINVDKMSDKAVPVRCSDGKTVTIVGYYESEADKLLSCGVNMDRESEEYKIVLEQLKNPTFYSVCGNFLE